MSLGMRNTKDMEYGRVHAAAMRGTTPATTLSTSISIDYYFIFTILFPFCFCFRTQQFSWGSKISYDMIHVIIITMSIDYSTR
jgi:hypothetical protein